MPGYTPATNCSQPMPWKSVKYVGARALRDTSNLWNRCGIAPLNKHGAAIAAETLLVTPDALSLPYYQSAVTRLSMCCQLACAYKIMQPWTSTTCGDPHLHQLTTRFRSTERLAKRIFEDYEISVVGHGLDPHIWATTSHLLKFWDSASNDFS